MGLYDQALVRAYSGGGSNWLEDLIKAKAHVKAHFRRDPKTGKLIYIKEHEKEFDPHVVFTQGDKVKVLQGQYAGKEMTVNGYSEDKHVLRLKHPDHPNVAITPHFVEHSVKTHENTPGEVKKVEPKIYINPLTYKKGDYGFMIHGVDKLGKKVSIHTKSMSSAKKIKEKILSGLDLEPSDYEEDQPEGWDSVYKNPKWSNEPYTGSDHFLIDSTGMSAATKDKAEADKALVYLKAQGYDAKIFKHQKEYSIYVPHGKLPKGQNDKPKEDASKGWVQTGSQLGGNPGAKFKGPDGGMYYLKTYGDNEKAKSEVLGGLVTKALGLMAPDVSLQRVEFQGKPQTMIASRWVSGGITLAREFVDKGMDKLPLSEQEQVAKHFLVACLIGDRDTAGPKCDNFGRTADGQWMAVERGGSFSYRGFSGKKEYGTEAPEFESMVNPAISKNTIRVFAPVLPNTLAKDPKKYIDFLKNLKESDLDAAIKKVGYGADLKQTIMARRDRLIEKIKAKYGRSNRL